MCRLKTSLSILVFLIVQIAIGQISTSNYEKYPVFPECENESIENLENCFNTTMRTFINKNFKLPEIVSKDKYTGEMIFLFEVTKEGKFKMLYVDATYKELKEEMNRIFGLLPVVKPATYSGRETYMQFTMRLNVPLEGVEVIEGEEEKEKKENELEVAAKKEFDSVNDSLGTYKDELYNSNLNIPFSHDMYAYFDRAVNLVGTNSHTASKPYLYNTVSNYYDFNEQQTKLQRKVSTWIGRKLWNEHMVTVKGKDYWFVLDPIVDLQLGKNTNSEIDYTYNNTRGVQVQGGLGRNLNFSATIFESQGRFADYFNRYAESIKPSGGNPAIIPGRGIAKEFKTDSYDYPVAEGYISYAPSKMFNIQLGHGKNFIGDGYRSLFVSDATSPYPFFKLNTSFWKIKYTNTWMWLRDVRPEVTEDGAFLTKYIANHYLSWNVSKKLNIGLFESVIWKNDNNRGFDFNYVNPIIFYRAIEFSTGSRAGNAIVGLSSKYKWNDNVNFYGQFILDEFSLNDIKAGNKSWKNKYGFQLGAKYYNAFKVDNLLLQLEYNQVRPYTYSHNEVATNYGHNNQSLAHLWGANFKEVIGIARYNYNRWFGSAKMIYGQRGLDFDPATDAASYGGNIFIDNDERVSDTGVELLQGNKANIFLADLNAGYIINPKTNLKIFANLTYRSFNPEANTLVDFKENTTWFSLGIRTDIFNWYSDF
ncbi:gliding motility protein RemB [uncultured Kordia sp.]|uniref:gliding motility protein RemB n=1 Tax=uncultured Kordia sp. TaxID=507699 RepID=UPI00260CD455|nr:gliding motility protein RemB [uncultured Kordia sp.]